MGQLIWQFATENSIPGWIIRFGTRCSWSHVDAVLPDGRLLGARIKGGVQIREPGYAHFAHTQRVMIETDLSTAVYEQLHTQIGKPYDWRAIAAFIFGDRDWREEDSWFCSELQLWAVEQAGFFPKPISIPSDRLSPRDQWLLLSPYYDLVV